MMQNDSLRERLVAAVALINSGKIGEAKQSLLALRSECGAMHEVNWPLIQICLNTAQHDEAKKYLEELVSLYPQEVFYVEQLANLFASRNDLKQAISCYAAFLKRAPSHAVAHFNLGYLQKQNGDFEGSIRSYKKAIELKISEPEEVYSNMSLSHVALEQHDLAVKALEKALSLNPNYRPALFNLAARREEEGNIKEAIALFEKLVIQENGDPNALARLADLKKITDASDPIISQLKAASKRHDLDILTAIDIHFALGKTLNDSGQFDDAFQAYGIANSLSRRTMPAYQPKEMESHIDAIIKTFSADFLKNVPSSFSESPIFVCGMFRSGTTLTEQILAAHQDVTSGGELDYFTKVCANKNGIFPNNMSHLDDEESNKIGRGYLEFLEARFPNAKIVTDKRPDNFLYLGLVKRIFPKAKIICTKRQPLDNCLSVYFHHLGKSMNYAMSLEHTAHYLSLHQKLMAHWESLFRDDIFEVNYDDLVANPEEIMRGLVAFCDLDWDPQCLSFYNAKNTVKTASSWQVRQPLYTQSSGRWKHYEKHVQDIRKFFEDRLIL